ncbi:MAG: hypothetical protein GX606_05375 [Elusimicrobia bacterium]|nr:hypothetical protein [Elusimicrobiota bacterium]
MIKDQKKQLVFSILLIAGSAGVSLGLPAALKSVPLAIELTDDEVEPPEKKEVSFLLGKLKPITGPAHGQAWGDRNPFDLSSVQGVSQPIVQPVEPVLLPKADPKKYSLQGILWNEDKPSAIINQKVVGVEEKVADAVVRDIRTDEVIISYGEKDYRLSMKP